MRVLARDRRDLLARGVGIFDHGVTRAAADIAVVKLALDLAVDAGQLVERVPIGTRDRILAAGDRSEEHTSELQSLMRISYAVFCLTKKKEQQVATRMPHTHDIPNPHKT